MRVLYHKENVVKEKQTERVDIICGRYYITIVERSGITIKRFPKKDQRETQGPEIIYEREFKVKKG